MAKVSLDTPTDIHSRMKYIQLARELKGDKIKLPDLYYEVIRHGLDVLEKEEQKKASQK